MKIYRENINRTFQFEVVCIIDNLPQLRVESGEVIKFKEMPEHLFVLHHYNDLPPFTEDDFQLYDYEWRVSHLETGYQVAGCTSKDSAIDSARVRIVKYAHIFKEILEQARMRTTQLGFQNPINEII